MTQNPQFCVSGCSPGIRLEPELPHNSKETRNSSSPAMPRAMAKANPEIGLFHWMLVLAYQFAWVVRLWLE